MKENQIQSCQKYLLVKTWKWHKKSLTRYFNQKKAWHGVIDAYAAAKHKIILSWLKLIITLGWEIEKYTQRHTGN